jgi:hypothetical protein
MDPVIAQRAGTGARVSSPAWERLAEIATRLRTEAGN